MVSITDEEFERLTNLIHQASKLNQSISQRFLPIKAVVERCGISKATIYRGIRAGTFPRPISASVGRCLWPSSDIDAWMSARMAVRDAGGAQ